MSERTTRYLVQGTGEQLLKTVYTTLRITLPDLPEQATSFTPFELDGHLMTYRGSRGYWEMIAHITDNQLEALGYIGNIVVIRAELNEG